MSSHRRAPSVVHSLLTREMEAMGLRYDMPKHHQSIQKDPMHPLKGFKVHEIDQYLETQNLNKNRDNTTGRKHIADNHQPIQENIMNNPSNVQSVNGSLPSPASLPIPSGVQTVSRELAEEAIHSLGHQREVNNEMLRLLRSSTSVKNRIIEGAAIAVATSALTVVAIATVNWLAAPAPMPKVEG